MMDFNCNVVVAVVICFRAGSRLWKVVVCTVEMQYWTYVTIVKGCVATQYYFNHSTSSSTSTVTVFFDTGTPATSTSYYYCSK